MRSVGGLHALARALDEFRKLDAEIPPQQMLTFLWVCISPPGITMKELCERVGIAQSAMSRTVAQLGKYGSHGRPGYGLLDSEEDPAERRRKVVRLTSKGDRVRSALKSILGDVA